MGRGGNLSGAWLSLQNHVEGIVNYGQSGARRCWGVGGGGRRWEREREYLKGSVPFLMQLIISLKNKAPLSLLHTEPLWMENRPSASLPRPLHLPAPQRKLGQVIWWPVWQWQDPFGGTESSGRMCLCVYLLICFSVSLHIYLCVCSGTVARLSK